ncbi:MAG: proprotein convertase P-domain-containing protein [Acidobacteriota bacterium]|nr:proprotein convertase P-domain-containing protein [Acidobacteriota bacterium]
MFRVLNGRFVRREIIEEAPLQPFAYDYDASTGALVQRVPLFFQAKPARVFDPNPVVTLNDPSLQDRNDAASAVPERAYRDVELQDVAESGPLRGPYVSLVDRQPRNIAPPDAAGSLVFNREEDGFEDVNAYFHIDRSQRYLQSLGYTGERAIAPYAIEVDAHAVSGNDNSFFIPNPFAIGRGTLYFGEGGTDDAEDADIVVHEYMHALLEWIAPETFVGTFGSESRALSEGFGDYWAFSRHVAQRRASGRDPYCFADWDARCSEDDPSERCLYGPGSDCLRRLDSTRTMADYQRTDTSGNEHLNGEIWSSALREIHDRIGGAAMDTIVLESVFDAPPHPTFEVAAQRLVDADRLLFGGAHIDAICSAMGARGILTRCENTPRGEQTLYQSTDRAIPIPDNDPNGITSRITIADARAIERVGVRVDITHPLRGDLRIELVAPDGTIVVLQQLSSDLAADIHTTFGITASPLESLDVLRGRSAAGTWKLVVRDRRGRDAGTLLSWALELQFAGDAPLAERPRGERAQMIPVVTHVFGAGATAFASDLRIANPHATPQRATLIFTRSTEDGRNNFSALDVVIAPGQTLAFDDVVESAFHTAGSGSLEVLGDGIVMSRTYAITTSGTMGQQVPPNLETTTRGATALIASPLPIPNTRVNFGIVETAGGSGIVRIGTTELPIQPFSHVQIAGTIEETRIEVLSGDARIAAYASQIDSTTSDPMFIPAMLPGPARTLIAPAIRATGANGNAWTSDLWMHTNGAANVRIEAIANGSTRVNVVATRANLTLLDVLAQLFSSAFDLAALRVNLPEGATAMSRVRTDGMSQFIPLLPPNGPAEQQLVFIESGDAYRTNIGIVSDANAIAEVIVYDAAGAEVTRTILATSGGVAQTAVLSRVINGRAVVRFLEGNGRAYASLVDNRTGDATFVAGQ